MKKVLIVAIAPVLVVVVALSVVLIYINFFRSPAEVTEVVEKPEIAVTNEEPQEEENEDRPTSIESLMIHFEEENQDYLGTVNDGITLEQLQNSEIVEHIQIINVAGSPDKISWAGVSIVAEVVAVSGRVLTLKDEPPLSIYIGENADIYFAQGRLHKRIEISDINIGDWVSIAARLQYERGDPLYILYVICWVR